MAGAQASTAARGNDLLTGRILPTLIRLSLPNIAALSLQSLVVIAETSYIGLIGTEALAAMALVFPMVMLTQMMSSGAMGGGVSSAISRALGANDVVRARALAVHALTIGISAGIMLSAAFLLLGASLYRLLGGQGEVLRQAVAYSTAFFTGATAVWYFNTLNSVVRGTGNMRLSSAVMMSVAVVQILLGGALSLGLGPFPRLGLPGVAVAQTAASLLGAAFLNWQLQQPTSRLAVTFTGVTLNREMFRDILKVGAVACLSPIQSILVVLILARLAAEFGTTALAGFGIGIRLELLLVPIAFAIGVACVPMVGMAIGAGQVERARRVAWTGASMAAVMIGAIGVVFSIWPWLWGRIFTNDPAVLGAVSTYLKIAGLGFPAYGLGLCLYFASQGSGKILGPVLAGTVRLVVVLAGGWLMMGGGATFATFATLATLVATAMIAYGAATALFVKMTPWGKSKPRNGERT